MSHSLIRYQRIKVRMCSARQRAPVCTTNGMGHWKEVIIITGDADYYCYTIKLSYSPLVYILLCDTMIAPDTLLFCYSESNSGCMNSDDGDMGYMVYR